MGRNLLLRRARGKGVKVKNKEDKGRIKRAVLGKGGDKRRDSGAMDDMRRPRDGFTREGT